MARVLGIKRVAAEITKAVDELLKQLFNRIKYPVIELVNESIEKELKAHFTYLAISNGSYDRHFGFYPDSGQSRMLTIVNEIVNNLKVKLIKVGRSIEIKASIEYEQIYKLKEAKVYNDSAHARAGLTEKVLDWLEWLLESGGKVAVFDAKIDINPKYENSPYSRSKEALMIYGAGTWSVPAIIAGTISDNWITQSVSTAEDKIIPKLRKLINTEFNKL